MSNFNSSYLADLIKRAQVIREQQQQRESLLARQQTITSRLKPTQVTPTAIRPRQRVMGEPDTVIRQRRDEIAPLIKQAESFQVAKKPTKEVLGAFEFFGQQSKTNQQNISSPLVETKKQIETLQRVQELSSSISQILPKTGMRRGTGTTRQPRTPQIQDKLKSLQEEEANLLKQLNIKSAFDVRPKLESLRVRQSRLEELNKLYGVSGSGLSSLQTELDKFYKANNKLQVSEDILSMADLKGWNTLKAEYEKNISLRNTYQQKYLKSGSKFDKDWFETYNKAVLDTAKNMSSELPKILRSAETSLTAARGTKEATLGSLQAIQKSLRPVDVVQQKERVTIKEAMVSPREQAVARAGMVSKFDRTIKKTPQFKARPI